MPSFLKQTTELWGRLKPAQRIAVVGAALATVGLIIALVAFGSQPEYGVLFSDLKPADAQTIVDKLKAANVAYKLSNNGTVLSVPSERVPELRLQMAASGALSGGHVGFDIFDKSGFGTTDFTQQVNYQRAIEGELAKTLEGMDEVESARVHITQPRESIFADKAEHAKASVMVRVRQGRALSRERTEAVVDLIASAVEGLDPADISVMDTQGRLLSAPSRGGAGAFGDSGAFSSHLEVRRKLEAETAARIVSLLEPITGPGHVRADVTADVDFSQVEQTEEKFDPKSQVIRSQQTSQESKNLAAAAGGSIVGARANDPTAQASASPAPALAPAPAPPADQRASTLTNFEIDRTVKKTVGGGGRVGRLSVSVVVDYKSVSGAVTARTPEELKKMQDVVAAAVGIDANRGDQIVVQSIPFDQPAAETHTQSWIDTHNDLVRLAVKYGALTLAVLLVILFIVRPAKRALRLAGQPESQLLLSSGEMARLQLASGETALEGSALAMALSSGDTGQPGGTTMDTAKTVAQLEAEMEAEVAREMASMIPEVKRSTAVRKQLIEQTKNEPEKIAMTIRSWLQEKNA